MSSLQSLREFIGERLAAAAEEIFRHCEGTIVQYEQELCRQRRLLDICWKPQLPFHAADLPQHPSNQDRSSSVEQDEQEEPEPPLTKEDQEEPEPSHVKEELDEQEEQELPQIKEEPEELCIGQDEEHFDMKQETETLKEIPTFEGNELNEADLSNPWSFNVTDGQGEEGSHYEQSTTDEETEPENRDQRKRKDRSHVLSVDISHILESQFDIKTEELSEQEIYGETSRKKSPTKTCERDRKMEKYFCLQCGRSCTTARGLRRHIRTHTGERPFSCKVCGKTFSRNYHLTRHMLTHSGEKPFSCIECHQSFKQSSVLVSHMLTHSDENLFSCLVCHKTFRRSFHLKCHMLTHTGEKRFFCTQCDKSFRYSSSLTRHILTHTGERPFSCTECNKSFSRNYNLKYHMLSHTQKKSSCAP